MKTFLEHLKHNVSPSYTLREILDNLTDDQIINEVNEYALEVAKETLRNAAENATITGNWDAEIGDVIHSVHKESILSHDNIPKL